MQQRNWNRAFGKDRTIRGFLVAGRGPGPWLYRICIGPLTTLIWAYLSLSDFQFIAKCKEWKLVAALP